jgi:hypothetical protein
MVMVHQHKDGAAIPPRILAAATALLAAGLVLRLVGLGKDLWLDEIWSIQVAHQMHSAFDALTLHHEINHYLNTVWLYFVGVNGTPAQYHAPALVSGVASVAVAGLIGLRRGIPTAIATMVLFVFSYELVLYSSEARGYSTLVLASLLSFYFLEEYLRRPRWRGAAAYTASALFGLLSHPIFAGFLGAAWAWSGYRLLRSGGNRTRALRELGMAQGLPLLGLAALYLADLRHVVPGGGTPAGSLIDSFGVSLAWAVGAPRAAAAQLVGCILAVLLLDLGIRRLARAGADSWIFFVGVIVVFPIVLILARGSTFVYTRHFLVGTTFLLILLGELIGEWWNHGRRALSAAVVVGYCALNGWHIADLEAHGRGQYREAIRFIADQTPGSTISIGGDQDFRIGVELMYYLPRELQGKEGKYFEHGSWPPGGPQWVIVQRESFAPTSPIEPQFSDPSGDRFEFVRTFPTAPLSGLHWFIYRNTALR